MKKTILFAVAILLFLGHLSASQENDSGKSGLMQPTPFFQTKERTHTEWYNVIGFNLITPGGYNVMGQSANEGGGFAMYYERLIKNGHLYYGIGLQGGALPDIDGLFFDLYAHVLYDYKMRTNVLGFGRPHFYLGASAGAGHLSFNYWNNIMSFKGIVFYSDLRAGFTINIGSFSALNIGYKLYFSPSFSVSESMSLFCDSLSLANGFELSFRF